MRMGSSSNEALGVFLFSNMRIGGVSPIIKDRNIKKKGSLL